MIHLDVWTRMQLVRRAKRAAIVSAWIMVALVGVFFFAYAIAWMFSKVGIVAGIVTVAIALYVLAFTLTFSLSD